MSGKPKLLVSLAALGAVSVTTSLAWACTAQFYLNQVVPSAAPSHSTATLEGSSPIEGPVEIRWGSVTGPRVDTATTGTAASFSTQITVPDAAPGVHYLVVVSEGQKVASAPFQVTASGQGAAQASAPGDLWTGFDADQPSIDGLGGVSKALGSPKAGLVLGTGLLAFGAIASLSILAVTGRKRRSAQTGS